MDFQVTQESGRSARIYIEVTYLYNGRHISDRWVNTIAVRSAIKGPECPQEYAAESG